MDDTYVRWNSDRFRRVRQLPALWRNFHNDIVAPNGTKYVMQPVGAGWSGFYWHGSTFILAWIRNHLSSEVGMSLIRRIVMTDNIVIWLTIIGYDLYA